MDEISRLCDDIEEVYLNKNEQVQEDHNGVIAYWLLWWLWPGDNE